MGAGLRTGRFLVLASAALVIVLLFGFVMFASFATRAPSGVTRPAEGIVVLTGAMMRIDEGMRLLRGGHGRRLLITGVNPITTRRDVSRLANPGKLLFDCCVDFGYQAQDTVGNAEETRDWVRRNGFRSLIVVTSSYHMPRSLAEIQRVLPEVQLVSHAVVSPMFREQAWWLKHATARVLLAEYAKLLPSAARFVVSRLMWQIVPAAAGDAPARGRPPPPSAALERGQR